MIYFRSVERALAIIYPLAYYDDADRSIMAFDYNETEGRKTEDRKEDREREREREREILTCQDSYLYHGESVE